MTASRTVLTGAAVAVVASAAVAAWLHLGGRSDAVYYLPLAIGAAAMVVGWHAARRVPASTALLVILVAGAAARLVLVPTPPDLSDDLYRYLWDGHVQLEGINPYDHPPDSPALAELRDERIYPEINRRGVNTIYPGGAQLFFAGARLLGVARPTTLKLVLVGAELLAMLLMALALRRRGAAIRHLVLYAWNPLPILAFGHSGHLDALVVLAVVAAVLAWQRGAGGRVGVALGVAGAIKLFPLLLLPAFLRDRDGGWAWWTAPAALATVTVSYLPYLSAGTGVLGFLTTDGYLRQEGYVSGNRFVLARALGGGIELVAVAAVLVAAWALWSRRPAAVEGAGLLGAAILLTTPYPWYGTGLVALAALGGSGLGDRAPRWSWLIWPLFAASIQVVYISFTHGFGVSLDTQRQVLITAALVALTAAAVHTRRRPDETPERSTVRAAVR